uniref:Rna-binding protein 25-like isoform x1 n=1 Tax=Tetraselmis sp. GSL018 TaxID=582737 RepID=A0A061R3W8_9CHLO
MNPSGPPPSFPPPPVYGSQPQYSLPPQQYHQAQFYAPPPYVTGTPPGPPAPLRPTLVAPPVPSLGQYLRPAAPAPRVGSAAPSTSVPPAASSLPPPVPRSTTLYVGKIPASVSEDLLRELLQLCGQVKSWSRHSDPETKQLKAFGFCEMQDAEGVLRALRLLNGREVHVNAEVH